MICGKNRANVDKGKIEKMKKLIGYCGIDCEKCDVRIATVNNDEMLREKTAELWSKLNNCEIQKEALYCMGCRTEGVKAYYCSDMCGIRKCGEEKSYETCGKCADLKECETLKPILGGDPDALSNLTQAE